MIWTVNLEDYTKVVGVLVDNVKGVVDRLDIVFFLLWVLTVMK